MKQNAKRVLALVLSLLFVLTAYPVAMVTVSAETPAPAPALTYEDLIVKDGLSIWLDGFDPSTIDLANKVWSNKAGTANATIVQNAGGANAWEIRSKGLGWTNDVTASVNNPANMIKFDISAMPTGSYTAQIITTFDGMTVGDARYVSEWKYANTDNASGTSSPSWKSGNQYGHTVSETFAFGPVRTMTYVNGGHKWTQVDVTDKTTVITSKDDSNCLSNRWYYTGMVYGNHNSQIAATGDVTLNGGETVIRSLAPFQTVDFTLTYQLNGGNTYDTAASVTVKGAYDGASALNATVNKGGSHASALYTETLLPPDAGYDSKGAEADGNRLFQIMKGMAGTISSFRMYDRLLTAEEKNQNHFADLVAYYEIDLSAFSALKEGSRRYVYAQCASIKFDDPSNATGIVNVITAAADRETDVVAARTAYDELYVTNGLTLLLTAFDKDDASVDLANGTWADKSLANSFATFFGGTYNASTKTWGWREDPNGGIFYRFKDIDTTNAQKTNIGISFPAAALGDGNFYIESVFTPYFVSDDDGKFVYATAANGTWGVYGADRSAFSFGCFQLCLFYPNTNGSGASSQCRIFNYKDAWGKGSQNFTFSSPYLFGQAIPDGGGQGVDGTIDPAKVTLATKPITLRFNRTLSEGVAYTKAVYAISTDITSETLSNGDGTVIGSNTTSQNNFWTMAECAHPFEMFVGFPAHVFAIRAYDHELTTLEQNQNHFADLAAYYDVDLTTFLTLKEGSRQYVYTQCASLTFGDAANATTIAGIISAAAAKEAVIAGARTEYDELYVQDGLTLLLSSFVADDASLDLANGKWENKALQTMGASIVGPDWKLSGTAVSYGAKTVSAHNATKNTDYIVLPTEAFGENFTAELFFKPTFVSDNGVVVHHTGVGGENPYGDYNGDGNRSAFSFGGLKMCYFMPSTKVATPDSNTDGCNSQARIFFGINDWSGGNPPAGYQTVMAFGTWNEDPTKDTLVMYPTSMTVTRAQGDNNASFVWTMPKATSSMNASVNTKVNVDGKFVLPDYSTWAIPFEVFNGFPADVYAIRAYNRVLTDAEKAQNRLVDLCALTGADLSALKALTSAQLASVSLVAMAELTGQNTKSEVEAAITEAINNLVRSEYKTAYTDLYVQDGLVMLLDAFDTSDANVSLDMSTGRWFNIAGGAFATLRSNGSVSWEKRSGGIGYDLTAAEHKAKTAHGTYIDLGTGLVDCSKDYTVEYVAKGMPTTDDPLADTYHTDSITEKFGPWGGWWFGNAGCRPIYNTQDNINNYGHKMAWPEALDYYVFKGAKTTPATATFVITNPSTEVSYFSVMKNSTLVHSYNTNERKNGDAHAPSAPSQAMYNFTHMWIMQNVANTTYAVRVYDRALTDREIKQNHVVDVAAMKSLDAAKVAAALAIESDYIFDDMYAAFTAAEATATASALETILADTVKLEKKVLPVAIGYQVANDGTSLRIWGGIAAQDGISQLGFKITVDGVTKEMTTRTTFGSITCNGNTLTAESKGYTDLYAAVVRSSGAKAEHEVTIVPFVIMKDGQRIEGAPVSDTFTFGN